MESSFALSNLFVMPFWLAMILAPGWRGTQRLMRSPLGSVAPAIVYAFLILPRLPELLPAVARPELPQIAALLGTTFGATVAWAHFLAFDLFVGRWIYLDARERPLSPWLVSPLLLTTLLLGPLGLLGYLVARQASGLRERVSRIRHWLARAGSKMPTDSQPMVVLATGSVVLLLVTLILPIFDSRQLLGVSIWLKPAKFAASVALTAGGLVWLLGFMQPLSRGVRRAVAVIAGATAFELVVITMQSARGVASHFNSATPFDIAVFALMGGAIALVWLALAYIAYSSFRHPLGNPALRWGIRMGLLTVLLGAGLGGLMPRPTAAQLESLAAGRPTPTIGAHAVGVPDGGPGLPITRWSTEGGDLRVPHFIGIHGLQLLPLLGWWIGRRRHANDREATVDGRLMIVAGSSYLGVIVATLVQALRGQPLLRPDGLTLLSFVGLAGGTAIAALAVLGVKVKRAGDVRRQIPPLASPIN